MMSNKRKYWFLFAFVATIVVVIRISAIQIVLESEQYQVSRKYVESDEIVLKRIGNFKGYGFWISGNLNSPEGKSNISFTILGSVSSVKATVKLERSEKGSWEVVQAEYH
jgi:hypothetical protein